MVCLGLFKVQITLLLLAAVLAHVLQEQADQVQEQIAKHLELPHLAVVVEERQTVMHFTLEQVAVAVADLG
jgi:thymidylate synthase